MVIGLLLFLISRLTHSCARPRQVAHIPLPLYGQLAQGTDLGRYLTQQLLVNGLQDDRGFLPLSAVTATSIFGGSSNIRDERSLMRDPTAFRPGCTITNTHHFKDLGVAFRHTVTIFCNQCRYKPCLERCSFSSLGRLTINYHLPG
jgi:hypothetical protein